MVGQGGGDGVEDGVEDVRERGADDGPVATPAAALDAAARLHQELDAAALTKSLAEAARRLCGAGGTAVFSRDSEFHPWTPVAEAGAPVDGLAPALRALDGTPPVHPGSVPGDEPAEVVTYGELLGVRVTDAAGDDLAVLAGPPYADPSVVARRDLLRALAVHAATALRAARRDDAAERHDEGRRTALAERDDVARVLQQTLLPPALPRIEGIDLGATYRPMSEGIGGDFYDVFPLRGRDWGIALGDVCGKGAGAAAVAALARHTLHTAAMLRRRPRDAARMLNEVLLNHNGPGAEQFVTAVTARLRVRPDGARLHAAVAGHPPLIVLRASGGIETYGPTAGLLGLFEQVDATDLAVDLGAGDTCVFYTDGATDVRRGDDVFGAERLVEVVAGCRGMAAQAVATSIADAVADFQRGEGGEGGDDLAIVVVRVPDRPTP